MTKLTDEEENVRRRFAVALGSLPLTIRVQSVDVLVDEHEITLVQDKSRWRAFHDHAPDEAGGHVSEGAGPTPEAALAACERAARIFEVSL